MISLVFSTIWSASVGTAAPVAVSSTIAPVRLTAPQLFAVADRLRDEGNFAGAEKAFRALALNPDPELRNEARFRLGLMLAERLHRYRDAAVEFRHILDETPNAARVRLELARMNSLLGNMAAARREYRAAMASGLPPEVDRLVRFYAQALATTKRLGGSLEVAFAPDSNINRATSSTTLGTVIGDLTLDQDARARSGIGARLRGQVYLRRAISTRTALLAQVSGSGDLYRRSQFDDNSLGAQVGPEFEMGRDRLTLSVGPTWRWYGLKPYSRTLGGTANWLHPMGKQSQLRIEAGASRAVNRRNNLQDETALSLGAALDRAFSGRFGAGIQIGVQRNAARDPGYSTASGSAGAYLYREIGTTTAVLSAGYSHLEADKRLFLYPERRTDNRLSLALGATFRSLAVARIAPLLRARYERNHSTVALYDYQRTSAEVGLTSAF